MKEWKKKLEKINKLKDEWKKEEKAWINERMKG